MNRKAVPGIMLTLLLLLSVLSPPIHTSLTGATPSTTTLFIDPAIIGVHTGGNFTINVKVSNALDLYSWQFQLWFDSSILECIDVYLPSGHAFEGLVYVDVWIQEADHIMVGCTLIGMQPGVNVDVGALYAIDFRVLNWGSCDLALDEELSLCLNSASQEIPVNLENGFFDNSGTLHIRPDYGLNTGTVTITILGEVMNATSVKLVRMGCADIIGLNVTVIDRFHLTSEFNLAGREPGLWDLVVTLLDGSELRLENAFTIYPRHVSNIYPRTHSNLTRRIVQVLGMGFTVGIQIELRRGNASNISAQTVVVSSSEMMVAFFDLSGVPLGVYNMVVIWPDLYEQIVVNAIEVCVVSERIIYSLPEFEVNSGTTLTYDLEVPATEDVFVTLQKTTLVGYGYSWSCELSLLHEGEEIASVSGSHDLILHVHPAPGLYTVQVTAYQAGSGILTVWASLPELPMGEWVVGTIYCSYGSTWYQVEVPPAQDSLCFEAEAVGLWSHFDIYYEEYGSYRRWISSMGIQTSIEIPNPEPGTYIVEFMDSAMLYGGETESKDQTRDILIRADATFSVEPPPGYIPIITSISTERGGNTGSVTIGINGYWFNPNATVSLVYPSSSTIVAENVTCNSEGTKLIAYFNLTGKAPGQCDLLVTNPDGQNATAPSQFIIEEGGETGLWIDIVGREKIRVGRVQRYIVRIGNSGNIDAEFAFVRIELPPEVRCFRVTSDEGAIWNRTADEDKLPGFIISSIAPKEVVSLELLFQFSGTSIASNKVTSPDLIWETVTTSIGSGVVGVGKTFGKDVMFNLLKHKAKIFSDVPWEEGWWASIKDILTEAIEITIQEYKEHPIKTLTKYVFNMLLPPSVQYMETKGLIDDAAKLLEIIEDLINSQSCLDALPGNLEDQLNDYPGLEEASDSLNLEPVSSATPEDKYGETGFDLPNTPQTELMRFVPADQNFYYKVDFWNKENATAPACDVFVKDQLDPNLDWSTFRFEEIGFLNWTVELEPCQYFNLNVDTRPEMDLIVNVEGILNQETGDVEWTFRSLNPTTMETPEDPMAGFLPPITESGHEIGWVCFSIDAEADLPTETQIANQAFVKFDAGDFNPAPKEGPFINTIDADSPTSAIVPLPEQQYSQFFNVTWGGSDGNGSQIRTYTIYVSDNEGSYEPWLIHATNTSATFMAEHNHTYAFYSIATDNVGNMEAPPNEPDTITTYILPFYEPNLTVTPSTTLIEPGEIAIYTIEVTNLGNVPDTFDVSFTYDDFNETYRAYPTSIPIDWITIDKTFMILDPEASDTATLNIMVPGDWAGLENATYSFTATATSRNDSTASDTNSAELIVQTTKSGKIRYIGLEIKYLTNEVRDSTICNEIKSSLLDKSTNATKKLEQALDFMLEDRIENANNMLKACKGILGAFKNAVEAQKTKCIVETTADNWIVWAETIINDIENAINMTT